MPAFTGLPQAATTQLLLKHGVNSGVLHQENVFIWMPAVSCSFFDIGLAITETLLWSWWSHCNKSFTWCQPSNIHEQRFKRVCLRPGDISLLISITQKLLKCCPSHPRWNQDSSSVQDLTWQEIEGQRQTHRAAESFRHACWAWRNTQDELALTSLTFRHKQNTRKLYKWC